PPITTSFLPRISTISPSIPPFEPARGLPIARAVTRADQFRSEPLAGLAHPADAPRRHAGHQREVRNVTGDDGAGSDETVSAELMAADDGRIGPDRCAAPDRRRSKLGLARDPGTRVVDVGEDATRTAEHV